MTSPPNVTPPSVEDDTETPMTWLSSFRVSIIMEEKKKSVLLVQATTGSPRRLRSSTPAGREPGGSVLPPVKLVPEFVETAYPTKLELSPGNGWKRLAESL